jgi:phage host-nuclease inhibitor protein Gam
MAKATKSKVKAGAPAPQSREQAAAYVREIGEINREIARTQADMNDRIAKLKETAEAKAAPLSQRADELVVGLRSWCDANRDALTDKGKRKFGDLGTGRVSWRFTPSKVSIKGVEDVLAAIKTLGLTAFVRTTEEINKEAMLADPDKARLVPGVKIGSAGESFIVEPFEAEIAGGAS